jgi:thioester reductase-like protein
MDKGQIRGAIFRPSIIVGATEQGKIGQFLSFYNFLRIVDLSCRRKPKGRRDLQLAGNPLATKNMVPVDWTAKALWHIIKTEGPQQRTYHLTNPDPPSHHFLLDWANALLQSRDTRIEMVDELAQEATRFGGKNSSGLRQYFTYLEAEPRFDRTNTDRALGSSLPFPEMGADFFSTILEYARSQSWRSIFRARNGKRPTAQPEEPALAASETVVRQSA